jgi:acyl carrier protein
MDMTTKTALEQELSALMVDTLNLELDAAEIHPEAALYGEGLGLDSIDMLELSLAVGKRYGVELRADDEANQAIFGSLRSLARHIEAHRKR